MMMTETIPIAEKAVTHPTGPSAAREEVFGEEPEEELGEEEVMIPLGDRARRTPRTGPTTRTPWTGRWSKRTKPAVRH